MTTTDETNETGTPGMTDHRMRDAHIHSYRETHAVIGHLDGGTVVRLPDGTVGYVAGVWPAGAGAGAGAGASGDASGLAAVRRAVWHGWSQPTHHYVAVRSGEREQMVRAETAVDVLYRPQELALAFVLWGPVQREMWNCYELLERLHVPIGPLTGDER